MRVYYDTEFLEQGSGFPIHPISIGLVREDGQEYYAVNQHAPWAAIVKHDWLLANVVPHLPGQILSSRGHLRFALDFDAPEVKPLHVIQQDLSEFLLVEDCELWAYYGSYDHVVLAQVFGRMVDMPSYLPYYTRDLKAAQMLQAPNFRFPEQESTEHHALADARWVRDAHEAMQLHIARSE